MITIDDLCYLWIEFEVDVVSNATTATSVVHKRLE